MKKSFTSKVVTALTLATLTAATLFTPLQVSASGTRSLGHGVKCGWVLVSYDAATGSSVYSYYCSQGA